MRVIGVGVDLIEVDRVGRALERFGDRFLRRVYDPGEVAYCLRKAEGAPRAACLAARFAVKEAVMKAMGTGQRGVSWREIAVTRQPSGKPGVRLEGRTRKRAEALGVLHVEVSLTHGRELAVAFAVAFGA